MFVLNAGRPKRFKRSKCRPKPVEWVKNLTICSNNVPI